MASKAYARGLASSASARQSGWSPVKQSPFAFPKPLRNVTRATRQLRVFPPDLLSQELQPLPRPLLPGTFALLRATS
jgi:hypothetical protein